MSFKKVIGLEHNFNGHQKFKLITCLTTKKGFMGLTTTTIKKRILYVFDPEVDKKGEAKMYFIDNNKEIEKQLTRTEYNEVAELTTQFQTIQEANRVKEVVTH